MSEYSIGYMPHLQHFGWFPKPYFDGMAAGTTGPGHAINAIIMTHLPPGIEYRVQLRSTGWTSWARRGDGAGHEGDGEGIERIQFRDTQASNSRLPGSLLDRPIIYGRVYAANLGWLPVGSAMKEEVGLGEGGHYIQAMQLWCIVPMDLALNSGAPAGLFRQGPVSEGSLRSASEAMVSNETRDCLLSLGSAGFEMLRKEWKSAAVGLIQAGFQCADAVHEYAKQKIEKAQEKPKPNTDSSSDDAKNDDPKDKVTPDSDTNSDEPPVGGGGGGEPDVFDDKN